MKQTSSERGGATAAWRARTPLVFVIPLGVYLSYLVVAFLIGPEHSCDGGGEFYFQFGIGSIPLLVAAPLVFGLAFRLWLRLVLSVAFLGMGFVAWVVSFSVSGMYFMCRLF